jgi:hypothetical protein
MDQIYFWILILFIVVLILDYTDGYFKKKDNKENFSNNSTENKIPPYFEENRLYTYEPPYTTNAINFNSSRNLDFKNFGTNGITPPFVKCASCNLQFDCTNFPHDVDDKNTSVCTKCNENIYMDKNNMKIYARSAGKPRVCREL